jgi:hypothetical protein
LTQLQVVEGPVRGQLTNYAKRRIAESMYAKGKSFIASAMLLRKDKGYEYVVLHLLCQGIEIVLKGILLAIDYDAYHPRLRGGRKHGGIGHDLLKAVDEVAQATGLRVMRPSTRVELDTLNRFYSQHLLRYGSMFDFLIDPSIIPSKRVLYRITALLIVIERRGLLDSAPRN